MQVARIVVVGCGSIGRRHARNLAARNDVQVELCEPIPENLAVARSETRDLPVHESFDAMLRSCPEMVVIATPHALHAEQSIAALEAGAHVLCEKPMSDNLVDAERMLGAADRHGRVLDIGFTLHFHPALQEVRRLIASGKLGQVLHVHWHVGTYLTLVNSVSRHQETTYGALIMDYAHQPDLIYWWLGAVPRRVHALGGVAENLPLTARPNFMTVALEYESPTIATINLNYLQHPEQCHCEVVGDRGWIRLDLQSNQMQIGRRNDASLQQRSFSFERDDLFRAEHDAFIRAARGEREAESPPRAAIQSMRVVEAVIESLRTHATAKVASAELAAR